MLLRRPRLAAPAPARQEFSRLLHAGATKNMQNVATAGMIEDPIPKLCVLLSVALVILPIPPASIGVFSNKHLEMNYWFGSVPQRAA